MIKKRKILKKVARETSELLKYAEAEVRHLDTPYTTTAQSTTAAVTLINGGISQGDGSASREGDEVFMKWFHFNGRLYMNSAAASTDAATMRIIIVYDKQTNGAAPSAGDILETVGDPNSMRFWESKDRYMTIFDRRYGIEFNGKNAVQIKFSKKLDLPIKFGTASTGVIANIVKGSIYMVSLSDQASSGPTLHGDFRITYMP